MDSKSPKEHKHSEEPVENPKDTHKSKVKPKTGTEKSQKPDKASKHLKKEKTKKHRKIPILRIEQTAGATRREVLRIIFFNTFTYLLYVIILVIYVSGLYSFSMHTLTKQLDRILFGAGGFQQPFRNIDTASSVWAYLQETMAKVLTRDFYYMEDEQETVYLHKDDRKVLMQNLVLGVPRLRQVRVKNNSCSIHSHLLRQFSECFDEFRYHDRDTEPFGLKSGTAWEYNDESVTKSLSFWGSAANYDGGGYYVDLPSEKTALETTLETLEHNIWITPATRAIFIDLSLYNGNLNLFSSIRGCLEMPASGLIIPSVKIRTMQLLPLWNTYDYINLIFEVLTALCFILNLGFVGFDLYVLKGQFFLKFWKYVTLLSIAMGLTGIAISIKIRLIFPSVLNTILENPENYANLEYIAYLRKTQVNLFAVVVFFAFIQSFQFFGITKFLGQINHTLTACVGPLIGFSVMFFLIFIAYSQLGYLVFGTKVLRFSSFGFSMFSLLRILLGDSNYFELKESYEISADIYFMSYIVLVYFVLINLFLAIIDDKYGDVKTEIKVSKDDEMQLVEFIQEKVFVYFLKRGTYLKCLDPKTMIEREIPIHEVIAIMRKCELGDSFISKYFEKMKIDPKHKTVNVKTFFEEVAETKESQRKVHINEFQTLQVILYSIEDRITEIDKKTEVLINKLKAVTDSN